MKSENPSLFEKISKITSKIKQKESMAGHTSFKVGGDAEFFVEIANKKELEEIVSLSKEYKKPLLIIGGGSNILISDSGIKGIVVELCGDFEKIRFLENSRVFCGAAVKTGELIRGCIDKELSGVEALSGLPGTIGGAVFGNAGTKTGDAGRVVEFVEIVDYNLKSFKLFKDNIKFSYRKAELPDGIITFVMLKLRRASKDDIVSRVKSLIDLRMKTQPAGYSAGSIFKNPEGMHAGKLIEDAGLKGKKIGGAEVSSRHANYIVNAGDATAADIYKLIKETQESVKQRSGVLLETEIKLIGFDNKQIF